MPEQIGQSTSFASNSLLSFEGSMPKRQSTCGPAFRYSGRMSILTDYVLKTAASRDLAARAAKVFPDGITTDTRFFEPHGIFVERASGTRK